MNKTTLDEFSPVIAEILAGEGTVRLRPKGQSMRNFIREGRDEVILCKPVFPLRKGRVYFYRRENGMLILHRCIGVKNGLVFRGDNQAEKEYGVVPGQIIGEVSQVIRGHRTIHAGGWTDVFFAVTAYPVFLCKKIIKTVLGCAPTRKS